MEVVYRVFVYFSFVYRETSGDHIPNKDKHSDLIVLIFGPDRPGHYISQLPFVPLLVYQ